MEQVPCVVTEADEETIKLDRLADNKISELTDWTNGLEAELEALNIDFDLTDIGFPPIMDFEEDYYEDENDEQTLSARERYEQLLRESQENARPVEMTTQAKLDKAYEAQREVAEQPTKKYIKVTCEKCGHVMFIAEGEGAYEI